MFPVDAHRMTLDYLLNPKYEALNALNTIKQKLHHIKTIANANTQETLLKRETARSSKEHYAEMLKEAIELDDLEIVGHLLGMKPIAFREHKVYCGYTMNPKMRKLLKGSGFPCSNEVENNLLEYPSNSNKSNSNKEHNPKRSRTNRS